MRAADLIDATDWAAGPLGPRTSWDPGVETIVATLFGAPNPMAVVLGPEFVLLYNDAYAALLGGKHPEAFGRPAPEVLAESWHLPGHGDVVERVFATGVGFSEGETRLPVRGRGPDGAVETVVFSRAYTPVRGADGKVLGVLTVINELSEVARALAGVSRLATRLATALTVDDVVREALRHAMEAGADHARVLLPEASGSRMARRSAADPWDESVERLPPLWSSIPDDAALPSAAVLRDGQARWLESAEELAPFADGLEGEQLGPVPLGAVASVPLPVGPWSGALSLGWHDARSFGDAYRSALQTVGTLVGAALARAQRFDEQYGLADALQRSLLPTGLPHLSGLVLGARYASAPPGAPDGGADFYDAFALPDGRVLVVVGDVDVPIASGRGAAAAAAATVGGQVRAALRALALQYPDPAALLAALDPFVAGMSGAPAVSAVVALIDQAGGVVDVADAGHPPPLLRHAADAERPVAVLEMPIGPPVGRPSPRAAAELPFAPGDLLVLLSNGLLPGPGGAGGLETVRDYLAAHPDLDPRRLCAGLLEEIAPGNRRAALLAAARADGERRVSSRSLPVDATAPRQARRWARSVLASWEMSDDEIDIAVLCLDELVTNAVLHARTPSRLELDLDENRLLVLVADEGQAPTLAALPSRNDSARGRGLALVEQLSAAWGTERDSRGTTVWFELVRGGAEG